MQTVLITGANGFAGYYLAQQLLQKKYKVIATGKGACRLLFQEQNFIYETMDFTNDESIKQVFDKYYPQIVVHAGAMSKPDDCETAKDNAFLTNVTGTIYLLKHAAGLKNFFIFLSTDFIFEGTKLTYKEDDIPGPVNYYGETKLLAEGEVKRYGHDWSIVRTVLVYGHPKLGRQNILTTVANALKKGETLNIFDDQVRTPTYVEDLASAIVSIIEKKAKGIFHISGKDVLTPYQMAVAVVEHLKLDKNGINKVTAETFQQPARRPSKTGFDISKARKELAFEPITFEEGLRRTFE
ncbi:MAG: NAD(P)-dependent oxidoreductase [Chitinophagaceae bacterium]